MSESDNLAPEPTPLTTALYWEKGLPRIGVSLPWK